MTILQVANLRYGFAGGTLFRDVTFSLAAGERASLVAPNGAGKSTLLRCIMKEIEPEEGTVVIRKEAKIGYYRQSHEVKPIGDVLGAFLSGFGKIVALRDALEAAQHAAHDGAEESLNRLARLHDQWIIEGGDSLEHKVASIALQLGFSDADLARPVASLSGGERGRLSLGTILAQEPDFLLLDEPTNHLDLDTIGWLEGYLKGFKGAVLLVSHDRAFLDATTNHTFELGTRGLRSYPLAYSDYIEAREEDLAREEAMKERQDAFVAKTEDFIRRNIAGQKTKMAQGRRKMLEKLDRIDGPEDVWNKAERVAFRFVPAARSGDIVLEANGLAAARGGRPLFSGVDLLIRRGERIGIVGPNGAGKSTLLKLLAGRGHSEDLGAVKRGTNLQEGYFDQHLGEINTARTAVEEVRSVRGDFTPEKAREYLARFRFWGDDALRSTAGFSGGERSRLALAKMLLEPKNLLFLDEPTNHLDIPAAEILEEALVGFDGTVLLVSHDRRFLETVTTRLVIVRDGHVDIFPGGYADFVATKERQKAEAEARAAEERAALEKAKRKSLAPPSDKAKPAGNYEDNKAKSRDREKKQRRLKEVEQLVESGEAQLATLREDLKQDPGGDWAKVATMAKEEQALAARVEQLLEEWATLAEELA